jgi:hypothetical protein
VIFFQEDIEKGKGSATMLQDTDKVKEMIKSFSILKSESIELDKRLQHINERLHEIEIEMSEMRNYLYRGRSEDFIQDVSVIVDDMINKDETSGYKESLNDLKEILELWLRDYGHYTRFGTNDLTASKKND